MVDALSAALPNVRAGKVRAIALFSRERHKLAPEIPTVAESGYPGFDATPSMGLVAPAKTPAPILEKLNREIVRAVQLPSIDEKLRTLGFTPRTNTRAEYSAFIQSEIAKWGAAVKSAGIEVQ
jgi:tripartite-type tricarboxylate transporter receptor subunit TctC